MKAADRSSGRRPRPAGRCGAWNSRESSNPEIPHEPSFLFLGWLAVVVLAHAARLRGREEACQADSDRAATGRGTGAARSSISFCPSIARWCRVTRRFFITGRWKRLSTRIRTRGTGVPASRTTLRLPTNGRSTAWLNGPTLLDSPRAGESLARGEPQTRFTRSSWEPVRQTCDWEFEQREEVVLPVDPGNLSRCGR